MSFPIVFILFLSSQMVLSYKQYTLHELCTDNIIKKTIQTILDRETTKKLSAEGRDSAALAQISWNSSSFKRYPGCTFHIQAPRSYGLIASISHLNLRKSATDECYDYIQFRYNNKKSGQLCGHFELTKNNYEKMPFILDHKGALTITISLDTFMPLEDIKDTLDVSLVFTVFKECTTSSDYEIKCSPDMCISKDLRNDGIINCSPQNCWDESLCTDEKTVELKLNSSNIALSAITSLILTMLAVILCMWICWKYSSCQNQRNDTSFTRAPGANSTRNDELNQVQLSDDILYRATLENERPSAPPPDDKDLPPSYESLFNFKSEVTHNVPEVNGHLSELSTHSSKPMTST